MTGERATGALHPIMAGQAQAWNVTGRDDTDDIWAWWNDNGTVTILGPDGDVTIPRDRIVLLARGLIAAHATGCRPEWKARGSSGE